MPASGDDSSTAKPSAVVGIGVCAASFESLQMLLKSVDPALGATYVVAVRQLEGLTVDSVVNALRREDMPVSVAHDGEELRINHVYVGGPDDLITLVDGHVRSMPAVQPVGHRGTIDTMLISLAEHEQERAVAVILAGIGGDGTAGVTATKKFGGLSIAEGIKPDGDEAAQIGVESAAGIVDLLLPVERIPEQIALYVRNLAVADGIAPESDDSDTASAHIAQVATILRNVTGNDFHGYKRNTFLRRIQRRMQVIQVNDIDLYIERLRRDREEVQHLFQDLLIGVTQFFRDPEEFDVLARDVLPGLFKDKGADDTIRIWVVGCATGEEAYTFAILMREHMASLDTPPQVQIFASDLDARALGAARTGRYATAIADHLTPDRLARWFVKEGETYSVVKELREMCIFSPHNLIKDAPFSRIDLLSCRNLLIYLNSELQNRVIPIFHFALRPGGALFLGSSENVTRHQKLFAPIDRKNRIFRRLETPTRVLPNFPLTTSASRLRSMTQAEMRPSQGGSLSGSVARRAEAVADRYSPAYVVIDLQHEVLHFSGRTGRYLEPATGAASLNLLNLVHRDLRLELRSALTKAAAQNSRFETVRTPLEVDGRAASVRLVVEPVAVDGAQPTAFIVLFQDRGPIPEGTLPSQDGSDDHVSQLEAELGLTKERLQATIEELESTNEELKSSNEEYQSINEELQSANEELETSKEELQSVNEELQTVNGELAHRVVELARANSDLKNLLESTQIATIFLDNELRIRSFTPAATEQFHLLDTDVGRPIDHVASRVAYPELKQDARQVLKTLATSEREIASGDGTRNYIVRVLPYRSVDNFIAGAVLTFLDVTGTVRAEAAMRESEARLQIAIDAAGLGAWDLDLDTRELTLQPRTAELMGLPASSITVSEEQWLDSVLPEDRARFPEAIGAAAEQGESIDLEIGVKRPDGGVRWLSTWGRVMRDASEGRRRFHGVSRDVTDRRLAGEHQQLLISELQHRTRNLLAIVRSISQQTQRSSESLEEFGREFGERLQALSRVQGLLSRGDGFTVTLGELIAGELKAHGAAIDDERVKVDGPPVVLSSREVQVLTLALHELATNAVKYGALAKPDGRLTVRWTVAQPDGHREVAIQWLEAGVEIADGGINARRGFGRQLIERALPYDLGAKTDFAFASDGVHCEIRVPLLGADAPMIPVAQPGG